MPIPFILGGIALAAGAYGVKKGLDAKDDMDTAKRVNNEAQIIAKAAEASIKEAKEDTNACLESLGSQKIKIMTTSIADFVEYFSKLKNVRIANSIGLDELNEFTPEEFQTIKEASFAAKDLASGGMGAIAAGSLAAAGAYGTVGAVGVASTGTAIAGLSGAAATNATLAWLGGGALSAGGFGMAGGMAVLGGIVAGPALAIGGAFLASKAEDAKWDAYSNKSKAEEFKEQAKNICSLLRAVEKRADQIGDLLSDLNVPFKESIRELKSIIRSSGTDFRNFSIEEQQVVSKAANLAKTIKITLDTSLFREDGSFNEASDNNLRIGRTVLRQLGE